MIFFFKEVRKKYPDVFRFIIVLDNSAVHRSKKLAAALKEDGFRFVYLPPYSQDLNPIEYLWKTIKYHLSLLTLLTKTF